VLQEFRWQFLSPKNAGCNGKPNSQLKTIRRVRFPDLSRGSLMELVNLVVQFRHADLTSLPPVEMSTEFEQSLGQFPIVRNGCPFAYQTFEAFRSVLHGRLLLPAISAARLQPQRIIVSPTAVGCKPCQTAAWIAGQTSIRSDISIERSLRPFLSAAA
jgi:hypothetical protein